MTTPSLISVIEQLQSSWTLGHMETIDLSSGIENLTWKGDHPLASQLTALIKNKPCSLPFVGATKVGWITFGGTQEELFETIEDLRCWILPHLGKEETNSLVTKINAIKPHEVALCETMELYFRWYSNSTDLLRVSKRLRMISSLLECRPATKLKIAPSLNSLRLDFVAALRTGDWTAAKKAIDAIDNWQLDTARNTIFMRIRMLYEQGDIVSLMQLVITNGILECVLPCRIRDIVLDAVYQSEIEPLQESQGWLAAFDHYQSVWQSSLEHFIIAQHSVTPWFPLSAYQAYANSDRDTLLIMSGSPHDIKVAGDMLQALPTPVPLVDAVESVTSITASPPSIGQYFWEEINSATKSGDYSRSRVCLDALSDPILDDHEWITIGAETLLEIFTDPSIIDNPRSKLIADEVLVEIIDTVVNSKGFPRREHALIYDSLVATWVVARATSNAEQDGQLLLGLVGAAIESSETAIRDCESAIRSWWQKRKVLRRLPWLLGAMETLIQDHPNPVNLQDLWMDGADWINRHGVTLSKTERSSWQQLGRYVGLDNDSVLQLIVEPTLEDLSGPDPLSEIHLHKVAVVSLHERAAKVAAEELQRRTGANVVIVTSTSADDLTRTAETADLILFVWAACTHAVYRAFDHVRENLVYVQGTGPSSIILAAEQWASHHLNQ